MHRSPLSVSSACLSQASDGRADVLSAFLRGYKTPHPPGSVQDHKRKTQRSARLFSLADGRSLQNRKDQNPHSDKPPPGHPPEASQPLPSPFQSPGIRNAPPAASPSHILPAVSWQEKGLLSFPPASAPKAPPAPGRYTVLSDPEPAPPSPYPACAPAHCK